MIMEVGVRGPIDSKIGIDAPSTSVVSCFQKYLFPFKFSIFELICRQEEKFCSLALTEPSVFYSFMRCRWGEVRPLRSRCRYSSIQICSSSKEDGNENILGNTFRIQVGILVIPDWKFAVETILWRCFKNW